MVRDIRICFVGDSFVNGTGDECALGWAGRLCRLATNDATSMTYYNLGVRRDTSRDILQRVESEVLPRLPATVDSRVVLSFGANDTAQEYGEIRVPEQESIANLDKMVALLKSKYQVLMVGPPPIMDDQRNQLLKDLNEAFRLKTKKLEIPFVDIFSDLENDAQYRKEVVDHDGAHPRSRGYTKIADIILGSNEWWF